jgi:hypothetical protein
MACPAMFLRKKYFAISGLIKKSQHPYILLCDGNRLKHPSLIQGNRKKMKIYSINPNLDIPFTELQEILNDAKKLH